MAGQVEAQRIYFKLVVGVSVDECGAGFSNHGHRAGAGFVGGTDQGSRLLDQVQKGVDRHWQLGTQCTALAQPAHNTKHTRGKFVTDSDPGGYRPVQAMLL